MRGHLFGKVEVGPVEVEVDFWKNWEYGHLLEGGLVEAEVDRVCSPCVLWGSTELYSSASLAYPFLNNEPQSVLSLTLSNIK